MNDLSCPYCSSEHCKIEYDLTWKDERFSTYHVAHCRDCDVEKHVTMSRAMNGTDHAGALEEEGLKRLVSYIRICELAMGDGKKEFNPVAQVAKNKLARSLVSKQAISAGTVLTEDLLVMKSPGTGLAWKDRDQVLGKKATVNIAAEVLLEPDMFG